MQPQMKELLEWAPRFADKWEKIFHQLIGKEHDYMISNIRTDTKKCEDCCEEMFRLWCDLYHDRTWDDLIGALRATSVRKNAVAEEISTQLDLGKQSQPVAATPQQQQSTVPQMIASMQGKSQQQQATSDGDAEPEGKKKSEYPKICSSTPYRAIIINNVNFKGWSTRSHSISDMKKLLSLGEKFKIDFSQHENLKAKEMESVLEKEKSSISEGKNNGLLVFIMTHGTTDDCLYGSDGNLISWKELIKIFESDNCPLLKGKPKIFIIHACRGEREEPVDPEESHKEGVEPIDHKEACKEGAPPDVIPRKADFLFVFSTTDGCVAYGQKEYGFIPILVNKIGEKYIDTHLEDILLTVKKEVAKTEYPVDGEYFKQMPSVISQMRDKVWFVKE